MKKINLIISSALMAAVLSSCGRSNTTNNASRSPEPTTGLTPTPAVTPMMTPSADRNGTDRTDTMRDAAGDVGNDLNNAAQNAGNAVKNGADAVGNAVEGAVDTVTGNR